jgi:hypothetical protein
MELPNSPYNMPFPVFLVLDAILFRFKEVRVIDLKELSAIYLRP